MNCQAMFLSIAVAVGTTSFSHAEEVRKSEIAAFQSVQQNKDYRIHLLGVTKGIAFLDTQEMVGDGDRSPGKNAVPWMRVATVIEKLTDKDEPLGFTTETNDGTELVGKIRIESNGRVGKHRSGGTAEMDFDSPPLRAATFPTGIPKGLDAKKAKVYIFTLSGKFQSVETMLLRFSFGSESNRRELVFKRVPLP